VSEPITQVGDDVLIQVHVVPRASKTKAAGLHGDRVKIQVAAPPVDGEANAALVQYLAKTLGVPKDSVTLVSGATGRRKTFRIEDAEVSEVVAALNLPD